MIDIPKFIIAAAAWDVPVESPAERCILIYMSQSADEDGFYALTDVGMQNIARFCGHLDWGETDIHVKRLEERGMLRYGLGQGMTGQVKGFWVLPDLVHKENDLKVEVK